MLKTLLGLLAVLALAASPAMAQTSGPNPVTPDGYLDSSTFNASATATGGIITLNTQGFSYIEFQFTSVGSGATFGVQASNDGTPGVGATFVTTAWWPFTSTSSLLTVANTAPAATNVYVAPVTGPTMRINIAALTSGTVTVSGALKRGPIPIPPTGVMNVTTLSTLTGGGVASGAADSGNPIKTGCKVLAPLNGSLTANNRQDMGCSAGGGLYTEEDGRVYTHISTATTTTVKSGIGFLHELDVNTCVSGATVTVYDNTSAVAPVISVITCPASTAGMSPMLHDIAFATGLTVVTSGATDVTAVTR
jgi:hypothetical protein